MKITKNELPDCVTIERLDLFRKEVNDIFLDEDSEVYHLYEEERWHSLTCGWAIGKGLSPEDAYTFAGYVRYNTDMG